MDGKPINRSFVSAEKKVLLVKKEKSVGKFVISRHDFNDEIGRALGLDFA